MRQNRNILD